MLTFVDGAGQNGAFVGQMSVAAQGRVVPGVSGGGRGSDRALPAVPV